MRQLSWLWIFGDERGREVRDEGTSDPFGERPGDVRGGLGGRVQDPELVEGHRVYGMKHPQRLPESARRFLFGERGMK
jgi:hypothetical protein